MRQFIHKDGVFIVTLPDEWYYKNKLYDAKDTDPDSFELLNNPVGNFQMTLTNTEKGLIPKIIEKHNLKSQAYGKRGLKYAEDFFPSDKFDMYMWFIVVDHNVFMAKYIYDSSDRNKQKIIAEIGKAKKALETVIFVEEQYREAVFTRFQFDKFMYSLGSSIELTSKAYETYNPIELVILLANQIDAGLRLCLILNSQIESKSEIIDLKLIYQKDDDKAIMEKAIYKMALDKKIIDEALNKELYKLYNQRNKVVHRYIISDITTKEVVEISIQYNLMEKKIGEIVKSFEQRQFNEKVGMYGKANAPDRPLTKKERIMMRNAINEKHSHYTFIKKHEK